MAIVRIVLFRAKAGQEQALTRQLAENISNLRPTLTGVLSLTTGPNTGGTASFTNGVTSVFENQEALAAYDANPNHHSALAKVNALIDERATLIYETDAF